MIISTLLKEGLTKILKEFENVFSGFFYTTKFYKNYTDSFLQIEIFSFQKR